MLMGGPGPLGPCHDDFRPLRARHNAEKNCGNAQLKPFGLDCLQGQKGGGSDHRQNPGTVGGQMRDTGARPERHA